MTDREKAIVMAYTGICTLKGDKLDAFYQYLAELYERPVYTHEWLTLDIQEKSKPDFIKMCEEEHLERKSGHWYKPKGMMPPEYMGVYRCSECDEIAMRDWKHHRQELTNFCPNCGAQMKESRE